MEMSHVKLTMTANISLEELFMGEGGYMLSIIVDLITLNLNNFKQTTLIISQFVWWVENLRELSWVLCFWGISQSGHWPGLWFQPKARLGKDLLLSWLTRLLEDLVLCGLLD